MNPRLSNLIGGGALLGVSVLLYSQSIGTGLEREEIARNPIWYPRLLLILLAIAAVFLILRSVIRSPGPAEADPAWGRLSAAAAVVAAYFVVFNEIGFVISSLLFLPLFSILLGYRRYFVTAVVAILLVIALWYLFAEVFVVRPPGPGLDILAHGT